MKWWREQTSLWYVTDDWHWGDLRLIAETSQSMIVGYYGDWRTLPKKDNEKKKKKSVCNVPALTNIFFLRLNSH